MPELIPTEIVDIDPEAVHYVRVPASRLGPLLAKAEAEVAEVALESSQNLTVTQAAMLASERAGKRMDDLRKARQDTPEADALTPAPYSVDQDKPNSDIYHDDFSTAYTGNGTHQPELDAIFASVMKEAAVVVNNANLLLSVGNLKVQAEYDAFSKAKYSADDKKKMLAAGKAMRNAKGDPSYPIDDEEDLSNAIHAVGRGGASHNAVRKYIIKRAKAMGKSSMIPENWGSDGSMQKQAPLYMAMDPATTVGEMPGSPAWESEDAERLIAAGQCLATLINELQASMGREQQEVAVGNADDQEDVWALQDAICAAEYALGIVARLAFHEEAEGAMTKQERLTFDDVDVIRQAVSFLKSDPFGSETNPAREGSGSTEEGDVFMTITKEDLAAAVGEGVTLALAKAEEDRQARKLEKAEKQAAADKAAAEQAEKDKLAKEEADTAAAKAAEADPNLQKSDPDPQPAPTADPETPDIAALVKAGIEGAISPLADRLAALEGTPNQGGPLVGAGGAGGFRPGAPRGGNTDGAPPEILSLKARIQKAEADGDQITSTRLRKELGERVLEHAWAGMGYPQTHSSSRAPQFTDNAASQ